ncbi:MAG: dTDP-glucose 4,6-dehydratase [Deltaproteobacteria bacterium]|jgi:dTDP-glucose 4,6-dehydratase|nr:dTDP-glucose 4,6-dehydratase [Deltaproteobacteria bacterium]
MKILVTGGAGFIASNFIRYIHSKHPDYQVINLDNLTYAGNLENLEDVSNQSFYRFVKGDITDASLVGEELKEGVDVLVNFAAESHVDRSIYDASSFIRTNILGTQVLLEASNKYKVGRFVQISTDEVYGSLGPEGFFTESSPLHPNSPYSASKAGADLLVMSYHETFKLPVVITRSSNNYGAYQFPEKFIPLFITNAIADEMLPLYGKGLNVRDWLHVEDHCSAIDLVLHQGKEGEVYNIGANCEKTNLEVSQAILKELNKPESLIKFVKDRLGHDQRYALDASKIKQELDWCPSHSFEEGVRQTIAWYRENTSWWKKIKSGEYRHYYQKMYGNR